MFQHSSKSLVSILKLITLSGLTIFSFISCSDPSGAPAHKFDAFRLDADSCTKAFQGQSIASFTHIWVLSSPNLKAWWNPNGMRAEAKLILDSSDPKFINALLSSNASANRSPNHVRTLPSGRIYHVLLFNELRKTYAHIRYSYRSKQADGSTVFNLVSGSPSNSVKDCPSFENFEKKYLTIKNKKENKAAVGNP